MANPLEFFEKIQNLINQEIPFVQVTLVDALGSVPQNIGTKMLVTKEGLYFGTIGGGCLENTAIKKSLELIENQKKSTDFVEWDLDEDIGMSCNGSVKLFFEAYLNKNWDIVIFGAGHVAQTMIPTLLTLDCRVTCIDIRQEWLDKLPKASNLTTLQVERMGSGIEKLNPQSFMIVMTMGHEFDYVVLREILKNKDSQDKFPYIGLMGSASKAITLKKELIKEGFSEEFVNEIHCPIGFKIGNNAPAEIAISITAELLQERDNIFNKKDIPFSHKNL